MSVIDVVIILLFLGALVRGQKLGFARQIFSTVGFFGGLILGAAIIEPHTVGLVHSPISRMIVTLASTLGTALFLLFIGEFVCVLVKQNVQLKSNLNHVDNSFGAVLAGLSLLMLTWLSASILITLPYPNVQSAIRDSRVIGILNKDLPPAPTVVAD